MLTQERQLGAPMAALLPVARRATGTRAMVAVAAVVVALICVAKAAEPEQPSSTQPLDFAIPSQPLANALHAYGRKVGIQVLYESRSAIGRQSAAVQGQFTPDEALKRLLTGTDLEVRHARSDAITLVAPAGLDLPPVNPLATADLSIGELRVRAPGKSNDLARFQDYSESVRAEIQRALLKNTTTGSGNYRAVLDLWIDPGRTVQKTALLQSTGDTTRDAAITSTIQGLTINRPTPADAPQPVRAVIVVRTSR
ncbi:STN domain-containing protein [Bradyrhizobium sp. dw_411]|uniref:STN domain-containing protein n=1 Tax=Bradyrhizobium sp. dw_411 TaxID=2720082 RepID=UPI00201C9676|nr:STN domain-containing protein [Bradyrhizobium sp. dw_411]